MTGARIDPYTQQISANGSINSQATPDDFGAQIGRGAEQLASGLDTMGNTLNAIDQDQGRIWAATAVSQKELQLQNDFQQRVNSLDPQDPEYPAKIQSITSDQQAAYAQGQQDLMDQAPGKSARKFVGYHMASATLRGTDLAMRTQAQLNGQYTSNLVAQGQKADEDVLAASPDDGTFTTLLKKNADMLGGLTTISPTDKLNLHQKFVNDLSNVQVVSQMSKDPQAFLTAVNVQGGVTTIRGVQVGGVPAGPVANLGADTVKPYTSSNIGSIVQKVQAASEFDPIFQAAGQRFGVSPSELKLRAVAESGLDPNASSGQADGIMQISPAKAKELGIDPKDPAQAINAAAQLLARYQSSAGGDMSKVDQMYYGGEDAKSWGPNTNQYAANLGAVRGALTGASVPNPGDPQVNPLSENAIAEAKVPLAGWENLTWAQKVNTVRQAESLVGKQLAGGRGQIMQQVEDAKASFALGQGYPGYEELKAKLPAYLGPVQAQRIGDGLDYAQSISGFMANMATMPTAQRDAFLQTQMGGAPGGDEAAVKAPLYKQALEAVQRVDAQWQKAPIQMAIAHGMPNAAPLDFSSAQAMGQSLKDRVALNNTLTRDYAAPSQMLTDDESHQMAQGLGSMNGADRVNYLVQAKTAINDDRGFSTFMNQVASKNPTLAYAANVAATGKSVVVDGKSLAAADIGAQISDGDIILNGRSLDKDMGKGAEPSMPTGAKAAQVDEKTLRTLFSATLGPAAFQSPDPQRSAATQEEVFNAVKAYWVAGQYKQGKPLDVVDGKSFTNAINAVTGGVWSTGAGGQIMPPFGKPMADFQNEWAPRATQTLKAAGYSDEEAQQVLDRARPYNLADGQYGFLNGTRPMTNRNNGSLVRVNFKDSYTPEAPKISIGTATGDAIPAGLGANLF
jgi:hypothetical protein